MSRLTEALVDVAVVHRDRVHVAEDEALVVVLLQSLHVADVQQLGPVKGLLSVLDDDVDSVVQLLSLQDGVQVVQPVLEWWRSLGGSSDQ